MQHEETTNTRHKYHWVPLLISVQAATTSYYATTCLALQCADNT